MKVVTLSKIIGDTGVFVDGDWVESKDQDVNGDVRLIQLADIGDGFFINKSNRFLTSEKAKELKCTFLKKGDLLIARMPDPLGRACIFPGLDMPCVTVVDVCIVRPDAEIVNSYWLKFLINSYDFRNKINKYITGTTRQRISRGNLEKLTFKLPELPDQIKIISVLSKSEKLIKERKASIDLIDVLLKSTFLKMFGDPMRNEKGWETIILGQLFKLASGNGLTSDQMKPNGKHKVYGGNGINGLHDEFMFEEPTIVIGRVGYYCGAVYMTESKSWVTDNALFIKELYKDSNIVYLKHFLNYLNLNRLAGQAAQPLISGSRIYPVKTFYVPIELQNSFALIAGKSEILKQKFNNSLNELENLYGSLSQKAFEGELEIDTQKVIESIEGELALMEYGGSIGAEGLYNAADEKEALLWKKQLAEHIKEAEQNGNLIKILNGNQPILEKEKIKIEEKREELKIWTVSGKPVFIPTEKPFEIKKNEKKKPKLNWEKVSTEQAANWIKENYTGFHFSSEMLIRFLMDEHITFPDYYSSEELKKNPQVNEADDLKSLIFSAVSKENPFLKLEQVFYNGEIANFPLNLTLEDNELIVDRSPKERSGIYFTIIE